MHLRKSNLATKMPLSLQAASQSEQNNKPKIARAYMLATQLAAAKRRKEFINSVLKREFATKLATYIIHGHLINHVLALVISGCHHGQSQNNFVKMGNSNAISFDKNNHFIKHDIT